MISATACNQDLTWTDIALCLSDRDKLLALHPANFASNHIRGLVYLCRLLHNYTVILKNYFYFCLGKLSCNLMVSAFSTEIN